LKKEVYLVFTRVTIVQCRADKVDDAIKLYEQSVVPAAKSQSGYQGAYLLINRDSGKGISITAWDTEANALANENSGYYQEQLAKFKDLFSAPPVREGYELVVQDNG
jgi:heme-degrading monooxygenase HmoA